MNSLGRVRQKIISNIEYRKVYEKINIQLFDTSLRDGIQCANPNNYSLQKKSDIFYNILTNYKPQNIEIGSMVSPKILPIMSDIVPLNNLSQLHILYHRRFSKNSGSLAPKPNIYVLIPNSKRLENAITYGFKHFSFITSVSNEFQKKNTKRTLRETKTDLQECLRILDREFSNRADYNTKLYISCINHCPISGPLDIVIILNEIMEYYKLYKFDEYCLCDTCGNLKVDDYEYLLNSMILLGIHPDKISVHLHVDHANENNVRKILWHSFKNNIRKFDVSLLTEGGCSVTIKKEYAYPNMTYEFFYNCIDQYLEYILSLKKNQNENPIMNMVSS